MVPFFHVLLTNFSFFLITLEKVNISSQKNFSNIFVYFHENVGFDVYFCNQFSLIVRTYTDTTKINTVEHPRALFYTSDRASGVWVYF